MTAYLALPFVLIKFWFVDAPFSLIAYFASLNGAFLKFFSVGILLNTFFKPLKNEYREGLVLFSRFAGMAIKTLFMLVAFLLLLMLMAFELLCIVLFIAAPAIALLLLTNFQFVRLLSS